MGVVKGGGFASPFGIRLYKTVPLPCRKAIFLRKCLCMGGGERAPVALCREPTEPAGETGVGLQKTYSPAGESGELSPQATEGAALEARFIETSFCGRGP